MGVINDNEVRTKSETGLNLLRTKAGTEEKHVLKEDEMGLVQEPRERPPIEDLVTDDHDAFPTLLHDHYENVAAAMRMVESLERTRKDDDGVAMGDTQSLSCEAVQSFISKVGNKAARLEVIQENQFICD